MTEQLPPVVVIGGGNMGSAIISGLLSLEHPPAITVCDPIAAIRERHAANGLVVSDDPAVCANAELILLAVKPQMVRDVASVYAPHITKQHIVVSILAGTTTASLHDLFPVARIVRTMPNTPMAVGQGMVGLCAGPGASAADLDLAEAMFSPAAKVLRCTEDRIDALTAVSGSGPAYMFAFAEAMQAAAVGIGFTSDEAALLVGQTISGSINYLLSQDGFPAAQLREQVTSPGGTTAAALQVFNDSGFYDMVQKALAAAEHRAKELAQ